jgi:23S rRNA (uracil1939-C5)-methyltransferase
MNQLNTDNTEGSGNLELHIEKLLNGGDGLARHEGQAIFVPLTAPGDRIRARIVKQSKNFAQAQVEEILEPGPRRREAPCPHYGQCGGCNLQHLDAPGQRQAKTDIVVDCFQRLGKLEVAGLITGPDPVGEELGYRNRIRVFGSPTGPYGLMRRASHDVVPIDSCALLPDQFNRDILPWLRMLPPVEQIVVRLDGQGGWLLSAFGPAARLKVFRRMMSDLPAGEAPAPGCLGILFNNRPLWGHDYLVHDIGGHKFRVSAQSFFQANQSVAEEAVATVRGWLGELAAQDRLGNLLGDLFCGVGLFSLTLADLFQKVVAIDSDESACRDAVNNVDRDAAARGKVTVRQGRLGQVLAGPDLPEAELWRQAVCLVDPPRTGLGKDGLKALLELQPRQVVYMSCDPATLARDAARLDEAGYRAEKIKVLDMFPQTAHIETLVLFQRPAAG